MVETLAQKRAVFAKQSRISPEEARRLAESVSVITSEPFRRAGFTSAEIDLISTFESKRQKARRIEGIRLRKSKLPLRVRKQTVQQILPIRKISLAQAKKPISQKIAKDIQSRLKPVVTEIRLKRQIPQSQQQLFSKAKPEQIQKALTKFTPTQKQKLITGEIKPGDKSLVRKFVRIISVPRKEAGTAERIATGAGRFAVDTVIGTTQLANLIGKSTGLVRGKERKISLAEQKKARSQLAALVSPAAIRSAVSTTRNQLGSPDPFQRTQGFLTVATLFGAGRGFSKPKEFQVQNSASKYRTDINLANNNARTTVQTKGLLQNGKEFTQTSKLKYSFNTQKVTGTTTVKIGKSKTTSKVNLIDKGGFYKDLTTGQNIPKKSINPKEVRYNIKRTTITPQVDKRTTLLEGNIVKVGTEKRVIERLKGFLDGKRRTEVAKVKETIVDVAVDRKGKVKDAAVIKRIVKDPKVLIRKSAKARRLDEKVIEGFLEAVGYDRKIINGLDRRTRIARALGLQRSNPLFKKVEAIIEAGKFEVGRRTIKGRLTGTGEFITIKPAKFRLGLSKLRNIEDDLFIKKNRNRLLSIRRNINIPDLQTQVRLVKRGRLRGFLPKRQSDRILDRLSDRLKDLKNRNKKIPAKKTKVTTKTIAKVPAKKKIPAKKQKSKLKQTPKRIPAKKKITKKVRLPKIRKKRALRQIRTSELSKKRKPGFRQAYNIRFRSKGKVRTINLQLPLNKALLRAANLVDTTTSRSLDVVKGKFTKEKDIKRPKILDKKFRLRRTKTALKIVEKRKFGIDTSGEKKGLTLAKKLKKRK